MSSDLSLLVERVTLRVALVSLVTVLLGLMLWYSASFVEATNHHNLAVLMGESGAALFIAGILFFLWELAGKRAFADEILAKAKMSRDLADAGIEAVGESFQDISGDWEHLFKNACRLDLFISYGHTWRNTQIERLDKLLSDKDAKLRVVLPDPDHEQVVQNLAQRFEMTTEAVRHAIDDATEFFEHRKKRAQGTVEIYYTAIAPLFSFYRFNNKAVFALYNHRLGRIAVPSFVCNADGFLYKYFTEEFEGILADEKRTRAKSTKADSK